MWVYILLLIVVFALLLMSIVYLIRLVHNFVKKYVANKFLSWLISFVPILLFILGFFIDLVNAIVVDIHLIIIVAIIKLIAWIIKIIFKKSVSEYIILLIGIVLTTLLLTHAYYLAHNVEKTSYEVYTKKNIGTSNFRIIQISDSHLGATMNGKEFAKYMEDIDKLNPDMVVITGDYVDDNTPYEDLVDATAGLGKIKTKYGIYFIYGNHDKGYFNNRTYNDADIRKELQKNGVIILEDSFYNITDNITLIGRQDAEIKTRQKMSDLVANITEDKYLIVLDHQPNDYDNEVGKADLVLSGHTHGGQLFPLGEVGLLLGANDKIYGIEQREKTTFIVNSGISDWAIKFKTGTIAEYVIIDVKNN